MPLAGGQVKRKVFITPGEKRRRAAALQDAGALTGDSRTARSVLECASPLALLENRRGRAGGAKLFHLFDDEHFNPLAAGTQFEASLLQLVNKLCNSVLLIFVIPIQT